MRERSPFFYILNCIPSFSVNLSYSLNIDYSFCRLQKHWKLNFCFNLLNMKSIHIHPRKTGTNGKEVGKMSLGKCDRRWDTVPSNSHLPRACFQPTLRRSMYMILPSAVVAAATCYYICHISNFWWMVTCNSSIWTVLLTHSFVFCWTLTMCLILHLHAMLPSLLWCMMLRVWITSLGPTDC